MKHAKHYRQEQPPTSDSAALDKMLADMLARDREQTERLLAELAAQDQAADVTPLTDDDRAEMVRRARRIERDRATGRFKRKPPLFHITGHRVSQSEPK